MCFVVADSATVRNFEGGLSRSGDARTKVGEAFILCLAAYVTNIDLRDDNCYPKEA